MNSIAFKMAEQETKEIDNAIFTLNTMYFFKCVEAQGFKKDRFNSEIAKQLQVNDEEAKDIIYRFAFNYFTYEKTMSCIDYIIKCQKGELSFEE